MKQKFKVSGMSCASCQSHVEKAVKKVNGVKNVSVSLLTNSMEVDCVESLDLSKIEKAVSEAGYKAFIEGKIEEKESKDLTLNHMIKRLVISLVLLIPLAVISMSYMLGWIPSLMNYSYTVALVGLVLSSLIIIVNKEFFISGFKALIHKSPNMDTLVSLGAGIAYIYSFILFFIMTLHTNDLTYSMKLSMNLSFESCGMILTFITIGKTLEAYSKGKTTNALKSLMDLSPKKALVIKDNIETLIDAKDIKIGDIVRIKAGENVACDGLIVSGTTTIDESMLTGESNPVDKTVGDNVYQGTKNTFGTIDVQVLKDYNDTTLSQIIHLVEEANQSKAPIARIADKIASIFVPTILLISLITFIVWLILGLNHKVELVEYETALSYAINKAITVLVISCPCGLGLATPVAIMVGSGVGAKNNILYKSASSLEELGKTKFVVLDKTGTITKGETEIKNIVSYIDNDEFLIIAKSLESLSNHPLSLAITKGIDKEVKEVKDFKTLVSIGLSGYIDNSFILASNMDYAKNNNLIDNDIYNTSLNFAKKGETPLLFFKDNKIIGIISVKDKIKEDSKEAIEKINNLGIATIMLTGDNLTTTQEVAKEVGIKYYFASLKPLDKQNIIKKLKEYGPVVMIGDGINDSVALTEANVGIAIGAGADVAIDSADVVLKRNSLLDAYKAIVLSKKTYLNILENLFWAFIYNIIMIPIACGLFKFINIELEPYYAALAMSLSSVCVVLNALRLNLVKLEIKKHKNCDINIDKILGGKNMTIELKVEGMMCAHCASHVKEACLSVKGIKSAEVSLENKVVSLEYDTLDLDALRKAIEEAGYDPKF